MTKRGRIHTSLSRWWGIFRMRVVPPAVWLAAVGGVAVLWQARASRVDTPGLIEARQAAVASVERGSVTGLAADLFDEVRAGQVLVRLDDAAVRAELAVAEAEIQRLQAEMKATERQLKEDAALRELDTSARTRTYAMRIERLRLDKLDHLIAVESDKVDVQRLAASLERMRSLRASQVVGDQEYDDARYQHDALAKKVTATQEAIAVIDGQLREATAQKDASEVRVEMGPLSVALAPLREAIGVQLRRVDEIKVAREALTLRSPIDGVITGVFHRAGEAVMPGVPIVTVADPRTMQIVSFVEQGKGFEPREGMTVEIRRRTRPTQIASAQVVKVGAQIERIPREALGNATMRQWGLRVLIELPLSMAAPADERAAATFIPPRPGEVLDVRYFISRRARRAEADPAT